MRVYSTYDPSFPLQATVDCDDCTCKLTLAGTWDLVTCPEASRALEVAIQQKCQQLEVDCRELISGSRGLESSFVANMVELLKATRKRGIRLGDIILSKKCQALYFGVARLDELFKPYLKFLDETPDGLTDHAA